MHRRPNLKEAIEVLQNASTNNADALLAINEYNALLIKGEVFLASRMVVDIVDHYYHLQGISHG